MHDEFYKIVSQIIPVLFLGLTLQSIFLLKKQVYLAEGGDHFRRNVHVMTFCGIVFSLFLGEIIALKNVYSNIVQANDLFIVVLAMLMSVIYIIFEFIFALFNKNKEIFFIGFMLIGLAFVALVFSFIFR